VDEGQADHSCSSLWNARCLSSGSRSDFSSIS